MSEPPRSEYGLGPDMTIWLEDPTDEFQAEVDNYIATLGQSDQYRNKRLGDIAALWRRLLDGECVTIVNGVVSDLYGMCSDTADKLGIENPAHTHDPRFTTYWPDGKP